MTHGRITFTFKDHLPRPKTSFDIKVSIDGKVVDSRSLSLADNLFRSGKSVAMLKFPASRGEAADIDVTLLTLDSFPKYATMDLTVGPAVDIPSAVMARRVVEIGDVVVLMLMALLMGLHFILQRGGARH